MAGTKNDVLVGKNADFSQVNAPNATSSEANGLVTNGELWIGSTATNAGGTHINVGTLTSPDGSITFGYSSPNITGVVNSGPNPAATLSFVDDFISSVYTTNRWSSSTDNLNIPGTATNPGLQQIGYPSGGVGTGYFLNDSAVNSFAIGGGVLKVNWVISLVTLSDLANPYIFYSGFTDQLTFGPPGSGVYFTYTDTVNSGKWVANCNNLGTVTSVNTSVTAVTGFVNLGVSVNGAGTSATFFINGVSVATIATNLPTGINLCPFVQWIDQPGYTLPNLPASLIDLCYLTYNLTIPR